MIDVTVVVGTYGTDDWWRLAIERAVPSAKALGVPVVHVHGDDLANARNTGLDQVDTELVCFLDADDELEPGYFDAMATSNADVRAPSVRYVKDGRPARPRMPRVAGHRHDCRGVCLKDGNWLVVGAVARSDMIRFAGGWRDWPLYEDWDLWLRCHLAGASIAAVPQAVYRAHVRRDSRNRAPAHAEKEATHRAIAEANGIAA